MPEAMKVLIGLESRLSQDQIESMGRGLEQLRPGYDRLATMFDFSTVIARVDGVTTEEHPPPQPGGAVLVPLPNFRGLTGFVAHMPSLLLRSWRSCTGASLVVLPVPGFSTLPLWVSARLRGVPVLVHVVGDAAEVPVSIGHPALRRLFRWIARSQVAGAHAAWYVTATTLQRRYPTSAASFGAPNLRVDPGWFAAPRPRIPINPCRLCFVGSLEQDYKGLHLLLAALKEVDALNWTLTVVGDGRQRSRLMGLAEQYGLGERIEWCGFLGRNEVRTALQAAHLFVLPSLTEGMPRALMEAMAAGAACVASRVGGVPELLPTHALVTPGDVSGLCSVLVRLITNEQARYQLAVECHRRASTFKPDEIDAQRTAFLRAVVETLPSRT